MRSGRFFLLRKRIGIFLINCLMCSGSGAGWERGRDRLPPPIRRLARVTSKAFIWRLAILPPENLEQLRKSERLWLAQARWIGSRRLISLECPRITLPNSNVYRSDCYAE